MSMSCQFFLCILEESARIVLCWGCVMSQLNGLAFFFLLIVLINVRISFLTQIIRFREFKNI